VKRLPNWLWPLPVWLWPRKVSTTPNGLQRLGRVLHWLFLGVAALTLLASPLALMTARMLPASPEYPLRQAETSEAGSAAAVAAAEAAAADARPGDPLAKAAEEAEFALRHAREREAQAASPGPDRIGSLLGFLGVLGLASATAMFGRTLRYLFAGE
jgi:hypothetical protein